MLGKGAQLPLLVPPAVSVVTPLFSSLIIGALLLLVRSAMIGNRIQLSVGEAERRLYWLESISFPPSGRSSTRQIQ